MASYVDIITNDNSHEVPISLNIKEKIKLHAMQEFRP